MEAISPIFPEPISQEDQVFKTTKDRLIQQISKVDREILKAEQQIVILKKKQAELEEVANKPTVSKEIEEDAVPKNQSLPQVNSSLNPSILLLILHYAKCLTVSVF